MLTKLTLTIEQRVVEKAKLYAHKKNKSVSRMVEEYLKTISEKARQETLKDELVAPITDSLAGMFTDNGKSYQELIEDALAEKYL